MQWNRPLTRNWGVPRPSPARGQSRGSPARRPALPRCRAPARRLKSPSRLRIPAPSEGANEMDSRRFDDLPKSHSPTDLPTPRRLRACLKNRFRVAQATRLCRPATRRTERGQRFAPMNTGLLNYCARQFRSAGRRPERASRPLYPFSKHTLRRPNNPAPDLKTRTAL